jgi:hypothetical protein
LLIGVLLLPVMPRGCGARKGFLCGVCGYNLDVLARDLRSYAAQHDGKLPASLKDLMEMTSAFSSYHPETLLCPVKRGESPGGGNMGCHAPVDWAGLRGLEDYVYLGAGFTLLELESLPYPGLPIVFDKKGNHPEGTRNVFFWSGMTKGGAIVEEGSVSRRLMSEEGFELALVGLARDCQKAGKEEAVSRLMDYLDTERGAGANHSDGKAKVR